MDVREIEVSGYGQYLAGLQYEPMPDFCEQRNERFMNEILEISVWVLIGQELTLKPELNLKI